MSRRRKDKEGTGIKLVDGVHVSGVTFQSMYYAAVNHYLIEVCDDKYKGIGQAIAEAKGRFLPDEGGAFIRLRYLGCNNEHYQWYIENEGRAGGLPEGALHHFCKVDAKQCKAKVNDGEVIHVRRWAPVERQEAHQLLVSWGFPGLAVPASERAGDEGPRGAKDEDDDDEEEDAEHVGATPKSKSRPELPRRRRRSPDEVEDRVDTPPRTKEEKIRRGALKAGEGDRGRTALDAMLDQEPDDSSKRGLEDKLDALRQKLRGKTQAEASGSKRPGNILAKRATEVVGVKKKKKRKSSSGKVLKELTKAMRGKRKSKDDSRESSEESSDVLGADPSPDRGGGWEERKKKYKKIAENTPGKLMMSALENMQEQLGASFGDCQEEEAKLSPVVTRYLLTVIIPAIGPKNFPGQSLREMRTIALAVDMLLKGKSDSCGDVLLQRFKSLCMQVRDNSDKFGPQIELLPDDLLYGYGSNLAETAFAREMALKEAKSEDLLRQAQGRKC